MKNFLLSSLVVFTSILSLDAQNTIPTTTCTGALNPDFAVDLNF